MIYDILHIGLFELKIIVQNMSSAKFRQRRHGLLENQIKTISKEYPCYVLLSIYPLH